MTVSPSTVPLSLTQILGSVLGAVVEAQSDSAQATLDFIDRIGFSGGVGDLPKQLRTVAFTYTKLDAEGAPASFGVELPLLGLVQIPTIAVKSAKIDFNYQVATAEPGPPVATPSAPPQTPKDQKLGRTVGVGAASMAIPSRLPKASILGTVGRQGTPPAQTGAGGARVSEKGSISLSIELHGGTVPPALLRALDILEVAGTQKQVG